jgi:hypothetical protein
VASVSSRWTPASADQEESHGLRLRGARAFSRQSQRRNLKHALAGYTQRLAAGSEDANSGGFLQDDIGKDGDGVQEMLAVVDDNECFARGEMGDQ